LKPLQLNFFSNPLFKRTFISPEMRYNSQMTIRDL